MARAALLCLLLVAVSLPSSQGLICYSCVYSAGDKSKACVDSPDMVTSGSPKVTCKTEQKYCTIQRQEIRSTGEVNSFFRGCAEEPSLKDTVIEDDSFKTYFRSCQTNLCNAGDGLSSLGGGGAIRDPGAQGTLIVPGIGSGAGAVAPAYGRWVALLAAVMAAVAGRALAA
ncbi:uncharacterized protein LOC126456386 [Schistocerca serialis cubense]|uniref:uncharacterized protein LOC126456386 n=1 Tax=Schistocerca serialis cubense TaxID=2023355 RepID=UPI00214F1C50|nr:uncharacterized protein LOC126456386 [Schistocerca serialis cubense]